MLKTREAQETNPNPNSVKVGEIPAITKSFIKSMAAVTKPYPVSVGNVRILVYPNVFPPTSSFSQSSNSVHSVFGNLKGKSVLDIGTGTGIQAIEAVIAGAASVDAVDINPDAVKCAQQNIALNKLEKTVKAWQSNLFDKVPANKRYDIIIANLPIVDAVAQSLELFSVLDPGLEYHRTLFKTAKNHLKQEGRILLCHADLQVDGFKALEEMAIASYFVPRLVKEEVSLGHIWRSYSLTLSDYMEIGQEVARERKRRITQGISPR
jgi:release factor glutamine methyltransferase